MGSEQLSVFTHIAHWRLLTNDNTRLYIFNLNLVEISFMNLSQRNLQIHKKCDGREAELSSQFRSSFHTFLYYIYILVFRKGKVKSLFKESNTK